MTERGFLFATTGEQFNTLARRAARSLRLVVPDIPIDLFTDQTVSDDVFDQVHRIDRAHHRPKMEALARSRFQHSLYLDADVVAQKDVSFLFELADGADLAMALAAVPEPHPQNRTTRAPKGAPHFNTGVILSNGSADVRALLEAWEEAFRIRQDSYDQPLLRDMLWDSPLRVATLHNEYNFAKIGTLANRSAKVGLPHLLHVTAMDKHPPGDPETPFDVSEFLSAQNLAHFLRLKEADEARTPPADPQPDQPQPDQPRPDQPQPAEKPAAAPKPVGKAPERGIIYATVGALHTTLARRAARAVRMVMPDLPIDLFTDQDIDDPIFDQIHGVAHQGRRPKIEAMARSRFDRSLFLDPDTLLLTPIPEVFDLLDRVDIAAAPSSDRAKTMIATDEQVPRSFPVIGSGVVAIRRTSAVQDFMARWEKNMTDQRETFDQPPFRRLLWQNAGSFNALTFMPLGEEYNLKSLNRLEVWTTRFGAPRILHQSALSRGDPGNPEDPLTLRDLLSPRLAAHVEALLEQDRFLGGDDHEVNTPSAWNRRALKRLRTRLRRFDAASTEGTPDPKGPNSNRS